MGEWPLVSLGEVAQLLAGYPFESAKFTDDPSAPRLLRGDNVGQGVLRWDGAKRWPAALDDGLEPYWLQPDDVIVAMDRPWIEAGLKFAAVGRADLPSLLVQRVSRLRGSARLDTRFLRYVIAASAFTNHILAVQTGTTVPHISARQILGYQFHLPPIEEQQRIAGILGALDDKIELNCRTAASLVELCRLAFESRLEEIKAEQPVGPLMLGEVLDVLETGGRPQGGVSGYSDGVPSIGAESITGLGQFDFSKTKYVPEEYFATMRRGKLENRDVLLYKDGGRPGLFEPHVTMVGDGFPFETAAINEHVYRLRARPPYTQTLLYLWLAGAEAMNEMRVKGTGVAIPGLNSTALRSIHVPVLRPDAARELDRILEPLVARVLLAARESRVLARTRDLLLPRLLGTPEMQ